MSRRLPVLAAVTLGAAAAASLVLAPAASAQQKPPHPSPGAMMSGSSMEQMMRLMADENASAGMTQMMQRSAPMQQMHDEMMSGTRSSD